MEREKKILTYAQELSRVFYEKPLAFIYTGDNASKRLLYLAEEVLDEYEVTNGFLPHRVCVTAECPTTFGLKGITAKDDKHYSFEHTKEVFKEAVDDEVWDCLLVTAVKKKGNVMVNPFGEDDEDEYWET